MALNLTMILDVIPKIQATTKKIGKLDFKEYNQQGKKVTHRMAKILINHMLIED